MVSIRMLIFHILPAPQAPRRGETKQMKALRRVMTPRADGSSLVPPEAVEEWRDTSGGGRARVVQMWEQSSYNKERLHTHIQNNNVNCF